MRLRHEGYRPRGALGNFTLPTGASREVGARTGGLTQLASQSHKNKSCSNVLVLEIWIGLQDLFLRMTRGQQAENGAHSDPHSTNAGPAAHHFWVQGDTVEAGHAFPPFRHPLIVPASSNAERC